MTKTYSVHVTREDEHWLAEVPGMAGAHTYAGNLLRLDAMIREAIAAVEDLPEGAEASLVLEWDFSAVGPLATEAAALASTRHRLDGEREVVSARSSQVARELSAAGWSARDIAGVLGLSPGRISQIVPTHAG